MNQNSFPNSSHTCYYPQPKAQHNKAQQTLKAIGYLISTDQKLRHQAQQYLQTQQNTNIQRFIDCLLFLSQNCSIVQQRHLCMLYLRNVIQNYKYCMKNITKQLEKLIFTASTEQLRQLGTNCMSLYLNKLRHSKYKKIYIDYLITKLSKTFAQNVIDIDLIKLITYILGDSLQYKQSGLYLSNNNQKIIHNIIMKYSVFWPNRRQRYENNNSKQDYTVLGGSQIWVSFILALCNYTGFLPCVQFVYRNILSVTLKFKQILTLTGIFNKIGYKFTQLQHLYQILKIQISRFDIPNFMNQLVQQNNFAVYLKSIQNCIIAIFDIIRHHWQDNAICSCNVCLGICADQFFLQLISTIMGRIFDQQNQGECYEIVNLFCQLIQKYKSIGFGQQKINNYVFFLCFKLSQSKSGIGSVFWLMANMKVQAMQYFDYEGAITCRLNRPQILDQDTHINYYYFKMITKYLKSNPTIQQNQQTNSVINQFLTHFFTHNIHNPNTSICTKSYVYTVLCQFIINTYNKQIKTTVQGTIGSQIQNSIKIGYQLFNYCIRKQQLNRYSNSNSNIQQIVDNLLGGLKQISEQFRQYSAYFHHNILKYLLDMFGMNCVAAGNICMHLFKIIQGYLQVQHIIPQLIHILTVSFSINNQALHYQSCQLILQILLKLNIQYTKTNNSTHKQSITSTLHQIIKTGILQYIPKCYLEQDDQCLYSQILMQLVIHPQLCTILQQLLGQVVGNLANCTVFSYYFDIVWEALVIVYDTKNQYVMKKGIYKRVQQLRIGNIQAILQSLTIEEQDGYNNKVNGQIRWSVLPGVRYVFAKGSAAANYIQNCINSNSQK